MKIESPARLRRRDRRGYVMLVALVLVVAIGVFGATSLSIAGADQRVSTHVREHLALVNAADAGLIHARFQLMHETPEHSGWDTGATGTFVDESQSEAWFEGEAVDIPLGTYEVTATYAKCSSPPAGYSAETGNRAFRSDYWQMESRAWAESEEGPGSPTSPAEAHVAQVLRKVMNQSCIGR